MPAKSRTTRKKAKRPTSTEQAEAGVASAQDVFTRFQAKAARESVKAVKKPAK